MSNDPSVAVVLATYNGEPYIEAAISSVLSQTLRNFVCTIVDDGSTDATMPLLRQLIKGDSRFNLVSQSNAGASTARNAGAALTNTPYLAFLDQDDVWHPRFLEIMTRRLDGAPAAHCVSQGIDAMGRPSGDFEVWSRRRWVAEGRRLESSKGPTTTYACMATAPCIASPGAVVVDRSAFREVGGFDPRIRMCEDWDLWLKLSRRAPLVFVDEVLFYYRQHGSNTHVNNGVSKRNVARVRRRAISAIENSPQQRRQARTGARVFYQSQGRDSLLQPGARAKLRGLARIAYSFTF